MLFDVEVMIRIELKVPPAEDSEGLDRKSICEKTAQGETQQLSYQGRDGDTWIPHREELVDTSTEL